MKNGNRLLAGAFITALGVLAAITPRFLFPTCEHAGHGMMEMACHWVDTTMLILGGTIALIGIITLLARSTAIISLLALGLGAAAVGMVAPLYIVGVCRNVDMPCNQGAVPMLTVTGIVAFLTAASLAYSARKSRSQPAEAANSSAGL